MSPDSRILDASRCGVIVIGRNEGEALERAIRSVLADANAAVLYVDSGSTDGSSDLAASLGVAVHSLDPSRPFSAARARHEGVEVLIRQYPEVELLQFIDGDCELIEGWLTQAGAYLSANRDVAIVCGKLREKYPGASVYNRISALQWNADTGDIPACGGIFMVRLSDYQAAGGFDDGLLTGEEGEFCRRVRREGRRIVRIDSPMAVHDSGFTRFGQWWARAVWGGCGEAIKFSRVPAERTTDRVLQLYRRLFWPIAVPAIAVCGAVAMAWTFWAALVPLGCAAAYGALFTRMGADRLRRGDAVGDATLYAALMILRKLPVALGFLGFFTRGGERARRPDPHAPARAASAVVGETRVAERTG